MKMLNGGSGSWAARTYEAFNKLQYYMQTQVPVPEPELQALVNGTTVSLRLKTSVLMKGIKSDI
jgi:hypothetical protein